MELNNARIKFPIERRHPWLLPVRHCHYHVIGLESQSSSRDHVSAVVSRKAINSDACLNRQLEARSVSLQVISHLVLSRENICGGRIGHPRQPVEAGGSEQAQRVPALAPGVAGSLVLIEDDKVLLVLLQILSGSQSCLTASDHNRVIPMSLVIH